MHQHVGHFFHKMLPQIALLDGLPITVFLDDVYDLADLADHPQQLMFACLRSDRFPFALIPFLQLPLHCKHFAYGKITHDCLRKFRLIPEKRRRFLF